MRPQFAAAHAASGSLALARDQIGRAVDGFRRALELDETQDDVRLDLARALERAGRDGEAQTEYRRLADAPETPAAIRRAASARLRE